LHFLRKSHASGEPQGQEKEEKQGRRKGKGGGQEPVLGWAPFFTLGDLRNRPRKMGLGGKEGGRKEKPIPEATLKSTFPTIPSGSGKEIKGGFVSLN